MENKKTVKWYEEPGAYPFEQDDIVYLDPSIPHLGSRFAIILGPSSKPNHTKARLQHPRTGEPQKTVILLDISKLTLVARGGVGEPVLPEVADRFEMEPSGVYTVINKDDFAKAQ